MRMPCWIQTALILCATVRAAEVPQLDTGVRDKTFVAWVSPANLSQRGGSVLTLENPGGVFDAVVFGEVAPGKWMAGSNGLMRTEKDQSAHAAETAGPGELVQIAIVYRGNHIAIFRNAQPYAVYTAASDSVAFGKDSVALLGLRHRDAKTTRFFSGTIDDARIYDTALSAETISSLRPNEVSDPQPWAWWPFNYNKAEDVMHAFTHSQLVGGAKIIDGQLHLSGSNSYLLAGQEPIRTRETEDWPIWHITARPEEGHCLPYDTNGCIFWKGKYHLMYIYQDRSRANEGHSWGHVTSTNLVDWEFQPPALVPEPGDADTGTFSGNAFVNKEGKPMLCWFGIGAGVCVATAEDDELIRWKKHPQNPIIPIPKPESPDAGKYSVWDPYLWLENDTYYCLLGGNKLSNGKDTLYLFKSPDLVTWERMGHFYQHPDLKWTQLGEDCSCPDFFRLGEKHVLMCISHTVGARCYVGRYENEHFFPEQHVRMNWPGGTFFAPESLEDDHGRRIFWAWVMDPRLFDTKNRTGSGAQSLPRVLSLGADDSLMIAPADELKSLRRNHRKITSVSMASDAEVAIPNVRGDCLELYLEIDPGQSKEVGVKVRCSPDGKEETSISYDAVGKKLKVDMAKSTLRSDVVYVEKSIDMAFNNKPRGGPHPRATVEAPFELHPGELLKLRVFLDKPLLEVFANDRQCVTQQIFPASREALRIKAFARGGEATIRGGEAWDMAPAKFKSP